MGKKALLVGINYPGTKAELKGCVNDVNRMHKCLINRYGFAEEDIVVLIDTDPKYPQPTGVNIRRALSDLVALAEPGDYLFFHYSGHGVQVQAETGDDDDTGHDECIVPCDMNLIPDQDFKELVLKVPDGCLMTIVSDSCHSGGLLQNAKEQIGESTKPNREISNSESPSGDFRSFLKEKVKDAGHDAFQSRGIDIPDEILHHNSSYEPEEVEEREHAGGRVKSRSLPLSTLIEMLKEKTGKDDVDVGNIRPTLSHMFGKDASPKFKKFMKVLFKRLQEVRLSEGGGGHRDINSLPRGVAHEVLKIKDDEEVSVESEEEVHAGTKKNLPINGVLISGCQTDETSADANTPTGAYGALSNAIQAIIAQNDGELTNRDLVLNLRKMLAKEGYKQKPGLYCTDKHLDYPFIC
ncbi:Metacaspase [Rhynchospora pubera]|uniref:Metacaspase n=1 Tax=Rhynchospora pubera TaxID=906938 RepID=A0AAV8D8J7_9POAL|nr:Metacaspase [Rhynchospora pubera]